MAEASPTQAPRILAIRGGAIGDFVLTLPALAALHRAFPGCHMEILGYKHIAELGMHGGPVAGSTYARGVRCIEYGALAAFFARGFDLDAELCRYFASFDRVVSWLFDPDKVFATNLERAGVKNFTPAYTPIDNARHASLQLAAELAKIPVALDDPVAHLVLTDASLENARGWLAERADKRPLIAIHPGSGSARKNWPVGHWRSLGDRAAAAGARLLIIGGEADTESLNYLEKKLEPHTPLLARNLPLPLVAALLTRCVAYFGNDTGISHIAAAVGAKCTLLFGPTGPSVWAPAGPNVTLIRAPGGNLSILPHDSVPLPPL
jgi:heptosyltransferase-2